MPARIVEDLTSDSRQFLLNEFNSQHTFNFSGIQDDKSLLGLDGGTHISLHKSGALRCFDELVPVDDVAV